MKKHLSLLLLPLLMTCSVHSFADDFSRQLDQDCAKIKNYAASGDRFYKVKQYDKAREAYELQVAWAESCHNNERNIPQSQITTAYNNVALTYIHQQDFLKAAQWLKIDASDPKSVYNLKKFAPQITAAEKSAAEKISGTYWIYAGTGSWNSMQVQLVENQKYRIIFNGFYANTMAMYGGVNVGDFDTKVTVTNDQAIYKMDPNKDSGSCTYTFTFKPNKLVVDLTAGAPGDCGFGHNVSADGTYSKVSEK